MDITKINEEYKKLVYVYVICKSCHYLTITLGTNFKKIKYVEHFTCTPTRIIDLALRINLNDIIVKNKYKTTIIPN